MIDGMVNQCRLEIDLEALKTRIRQVNTVTSARQVFSIVKFRNSNHVIS